jgi:hypothetical protein
MGVRADRPEESAALTVTRSFDVRASLARAPRVSWKNTRPARRAGMGWCPVRATTDPSETMARLTRHDRGFKQPTGTSPRPLGIRTKAREVNTSRCGGSAVGAEVCKTRP